VSAATKQRCLSTGCTNWARESGFCSRHTREQLVHADRSEAEDRRARREAFEARLAGGDYRQLLGPELNQIMRQAAAADGVDDELGALRYAMMRVLAEETDPERLAKSVAKLGQASIAAVRAKRLLAGQTADALTDAITNILMELE
jgi:hypothetical protein